MKKDVQLQQSIKRALIWTDLTEAELIKRFGYRAAAEEVQEALAELVGRGEVGIKQLPMPAPTYRTRQE